jgi:Flp pilus assembly protein TadG
MILPVLKRLERDRSGNFAITTALLLPVLLGTAGIAIDFTSALEKKAQLQALVDAATLATASAMADRDMTDAEAQAFAESYFTSHMGALDAPTDESAEEKAIREAAIANGLTVSASTKSGTGSGQIFNVKMSMTYQMQLSGLSNVIGFKTLQIRVASDTQSGREGNALSMYLALDESGSMAELTSTINPAQPKKQEAYECWYGTRTCYRTVDNYLSKMASLKAAAAGMFLELQAADPKSELIRMGAVSYDDTTKTEQPIRWGTTAVSSYVSKLPDVPNGGTDATGAMTKAFNALKKANTTEATEQAKKFNTSFERFIVLMTDGEMTGNSASWNSVIDTKVRSLCQQAKDDGIKIYTIAFMAPSRGQSLLSACATSKDYYYQPNDMTSLVKSFGDIARKAAKTGTRLTN